MLNPVEKTLFDAVRTRLYAGHKVDAAREITDFSKVRVKLDDNPATVEPILQNYLHTLLDGGHMIESAQLLWTPTQFNPTSQYTKDVWNLFDTASLGLLMGGASCSKSYSMGVRLFLEWVRDPAWTTVKVVGPSEDHLEQNLFSHLVGLHQKATLRMPGTIGELFIGIDRRQQYSSIKGVIIPIGQKKKAGRLQGAKRIPRDTPHPDFGPLSRLYIFIDEIENVPGGLWSDIDNVIAVIDGERGGIGGKIFGAYNPTNRTDEVGIRAEPPFGWENFNVDEHYRWKSTRGWDVLRLDGEKSENVVQGKVIFPGLQTREGLERLARNSGGLNSAGYYSMGRGAYPPSGIEMTLIPPGMFQKARATYVWYDTPTPAAGCDLALDGGANCSYAIGKYGRVSGITFPPSLEYPQGQTVMFKDRMGNVTPRWGCQLEQIFVLPKGQTVQMTESVISTSKRAGIRGENLALDKTGHGRGVADLVHHNWSPAVVAVNYSDGCSTTKILAEDESPCDERYDRIHTELWFALRSLFEYQFMVINPALDVSKVEQQITQRKYVPSGKKSRIESKKDFVSRGYQSPDEADAVTLFAHVCRKNSGVTLSMTGTVLGDSDAFDDESWYEGRYPGGVRIDVTNRTEHLSETD